MDIQYDVIVVGAGNGGLSAAANTAKAGLKTLVLEKHNLPGRRETVSFQISVYPSDLRKRWNKRIGHLLRPPEKPKVS